MRLASKVAVVTGAATGLGEAFALRLAADGASIAVWDIDAEGSQKTADTIRERNGNAIALRVDVSSEPEVMEAARVTFETLGRIDILVNNAGIVRNLARVPIEDLKLDDWNRVIAVNLTGAFLVSKAVVPYMKRAGWGRIINIGSSIALHGRSGRQDYAASKAGIIGLTRALAVDLGQHNITVNVVTPGGVGTPAMLEELKRRPTPVQTANKCIGRLLTTDDLVGLIALLASDESAMITGQVINVDGGTVFVG